MILHLTDAVKEGYTKVLIRTVDIDVLVAYWQWQQSNTSTSLSFGLPLELVKVFVIYRLMRWQGH